MTASQRMVMDHVLDRLSIEGTMSLGEILASLPELSANPHGTEIVRLLLRLDRRVRPVSEDRWALVVTMQTPEQRIVASTLAYLEGIPAGGALLSSIVGHVAGETNYDESIVRSAILRRFENKGTVVRNKLKETR